MSNKGKRANEAAKSTGADTAVRCLAVMHDPIAQRLIPFSFSEEELKDICDRLPSIHADIAEAIKNEKRKNLRESLRKIAHKYINPNKYKCNICYFYMEAYCLLMVDELPGSNERKVSFEEFLVEFPDFCASNDLNELYKLRNLLFVAFTFRQPENNRGHLIELCTKILEGRNKKYPTGSGATLETRNRVVMFEALQAKNVSDSSLLDLLFSIIDEHNSVTVARIAEETGSEHSQSNTDIRVSGPSVGICFDKVTGEASVTKVVDQFDTASIGIDDFVIFGCESFSRTSSHNCCMIQNIVSLDNEGRVTESLSLIIVSDSDTDSSVATPLHRRPSREAPKLIKNDLSAYKIPSEEYSEIRDGGTSKFRRTEKPTVDVVKVLKRAAKAFQIENVEKFRTITECIDDLFAIIEKDLHPKKVHQALLEFAISVGVDPYVPIRKNDELLLIEACMIEYVSEIGIFNDEFKDMAGLMALFPEFAVVDEEEKQKLLNWYNKMTIALRVMPAKGNKIALLKLLARLLEGPVEYILGNGARPETKNRTLIYNFLGRVEPRKIDRKKRGDDHDISCDLFDDHDISCDLFESSLSLQVIPTVPIQSIGEGLDKSVKIASNITGTDATAWPIETLPSMPNLHVLTAESRVEDILVTVKTVCREYSSDLQGESSMLEDEVILSCLEEVSRTISLTLITSNQLGVEPAFTFDVFADPYPVDSIATDSKRRMHFEKDVTQAEFSTIRTLNISRENSDYDIDELVSDWCNTLSVHSTVSKEVIKKDLVPKNL